MRGKIGFVFGLGHGHTAQFMNFRECFPASRADQVDWIPLSGDSSGSPLGGFAALPYSIRYRINQAWHARAGLSGRDWSALFFASETASLLPYMRRHPSFIYKDMTPSLKRELSPWYDHQIRGNPLLIASRNRLQRLMCRACNGVFTMSRWAANGICGDFDIPAGNVHVVLPGANLRRWEFVDRSDRDGRLPVRILMVGGEFRLKGGELMLQWAEATSAAGWEIDIVTWPGSLPDWVAECIGRPAPGEPVSASLAPRLPSVRIHCGLSANSPEIMALYRSADIFCLPTQADGSSIASLEAMAAGLPVIVGAVGGIPELIEHDRTGVLIPRSDPLALGHALESLLPDRSRRLTLGRNARAACEAFYNVDRQIGEILRVIEQETGRS